MAQQFPDVRFPGWEIIRKLGEGSFGGVYEIQRKLPDGRVETAALKKMSIPRDQEEVYVLQSQSFSGEQITAYFKKQMEELVREYLFMQKLSGLFLNHQIRIHEMIPQHFCKNYSYCTFSRTRHTDQCHILLHLLFVLSVSHQKLLPDPQVLYYKCHKLISWIFQFSGSFF